eukprot:8649318-Pyramimonas_sp.AAC.1
MRNLVLFPANCLSPWARVHSIPALCAEYVAALEAPDLVVIHEQVQAYGTLTEVAVNEDGRCCRWPDTHLALQGGFTGLEPNS